MRQQASILDGWSGGILDTMSDFEARSADFMEQRLKDINTLAAMSGDPDMLLARIRELASKEAIESIRQRALESPQTTE